MNVPSSRLKIALLSSYVPESTGIGPYSEGMAEALASRGHSESDGFISFEIPVRSTALLLVVG